MGQEEKEDKEYCGLEGADMGLKMREVNKK